MVVLYFCIKISGNMNSVRNLSKKVDNTLLLNFKIKIKSFFGSNLFWKPFNHFSTNIQQNPPVVKEQ